MPSLGWDGERNERHAAALVAALALCAQGADYRTRDRYRGPDRDGAHGGRGLAAECRIDEGKPAEPAADLAARRWDRDLRFGGDLRVFRLAQQGHETVPRKISRAARRTAPPRARRRHAGYDADVARRDAAPGRQSIDQAHAGVAPEDECLGRYAGRAGRRAFAVAFLDWPYRNRGRARLHRFPLSRVGLAQRPSAPDRVV